jgi:hypothetical protein
MTGTLAATLIDRAFQERLGALLEERAPRIDAAELAAQSTVRLLVTEGLLPTVERASPHMPAPFDLLRAGSFSRPWPGSTWPVLSRSGAT